MHAVIRRYEGVKSVDEIARRAEQGLQPLIQQMPGYVAYWAIDAGNGVVASLSVFQDRNRAVAATQRVRSWVQEKLAELMPNPPQVTMGEVVFGKAG